LTFPLSSRQF